LKVERKDEGFNTQVTEDAEGTEKKGKRTGKEGKEHRSNDRPLQRRTI
jgi:hypothetical protein